MPVLPLEPFVYPDNLLMQPFAPADPSWRWWVLHTRPRAEKTLARNLLKHQIAFFLPLFQRSQRFRGRLVTSHLPLFPGYVFLLGDNQDRLLPGTPVEITAGPLAGLEGKIIRKGKRLKFIIEVHFLQRGASVEIDSWMIEPRGS